MMKHLQKIRYRVNGNRLAIKIYYSEKLNNAEIRRIVKLFSDCFSETFIYTVNLRINVMPVLVGANFYYFMANVRIYGDSNDYLVTSESNAFNDHMAQTLILLSELFNIKLNELVDDILRLNKKEEPRADNPDASSSDLDKTIDVDQILKDFEKERKKRPKPPPDQSR